MRLGEQESRNDITNGLIVDGDWGRFDDLDIGESVGGEAGGETAGDQVGGIDLVVSEGLRSTVSQWLGE